MTNPENITKKINALLQQKFGEDCIIRQEQDNCPTVKADVLRPTDREPEKMVLPNPNFNDFSNPDSVRKFNRFVDMLESMPDLGCPE